MRRLLAVLASLLIGSLARAGDAPAPAAPSGDLKQWLTDYVKASDYLTNGNNVGDKKLWTCDLPDAKDQISSLKKRVKKGQQGTDPDVMGTLMHDPHSNFQKLDTRQFNTRELSRIFSDSSNLKVGIDQIAPGQAPAGTPQLVHVTDGIAGGTVDPGPSGAFPVMGYVLEYSRHARVGGPGVPRGMNQLIGAQAQLAAEKIRIADGYKCDVQLPDLQKQFTRKAALHGSLGFAFKTIQTHTAIPYKKFKEYFLDENGNFMRSKFSGIGACYGIEQLVNSIKLALQTQQDSLDKLVQFNETHGAQYTADAANLTPRIASCVSAGDSGAAPAPNRTSQVTGRATP